jgi:hypothetical protein
VKVILQVKAGCQAEGVKREVWFALGVMAAVHWRMFQRVLVATSLTDGAHGPKSLHAAGWAVDVRTRDMSDAEKRAFHAACAELLDGHGFDLVCEGPPWNARAAHEHCEFDPKAGEEFLTGEG